MRTKLAPTVRVAVALNPLPEAVTVELPPGATGIVNVHENPPEEEVVPVQSEVVEFHTSEYGAVAPNPTPEALTALPTVSEGTTSVRNGSAVITTEAELDPSSAVMVCAPPGPDGIAKVHENPPEEFVEPVQRTVDEFQETV